MKKAWKKCGKGKKGTKERKMKKKTIVEKRKM